MLLKKRIKEIEMRIEMVKQMWFDVDVNSIYIIFEFTYDLEILKDQLSNSLYR